MRNTTTNSINLGVLAIFVVSPFVGYLSLTFLHKGFLTVVMPVLILAVILMLFLRKELTFTKPMIALFLFAMYTIISDGFIANKEYNPSYFLSNELLGSMLVFFMVDNTLFKDNYMKKIFNISIVVLLIAMVVILIQQFKNTTFFVSPVEAQSLKLQPAWDTRLPSIYSWVGPLWILGHCFFPVLAVIIAHHLKKQLPYVWVFFIIGAIVSFLSKSRFVLLNFMILFLLIPIYRKIELKSLIKVSFMMAILIISLFFILNKTNFNAGTIIEKRILESDRGGITKSAAGTRILAFGIFERLYAENALFGKGKIHDFTANSRDQELVRALAGRSSQIHVGFLSAYYYYGIVGGSLFVLFLVYCTKGLYDSAKIHHDWGPFFGFIQLILANLTMVNFHILIMGYITCFMFDKYYLHLMESQHES